MAANKKPATSSNIFDDVLGMFNEIQQDMKGEPLTAESMGGVVEKLQEGLKQINNKAEEIYAKAGMSADEVKKYSENSNNFTKQEWQLLQRIKGEIDQYKTEVDEIMGPISGKGIDEKIIKDQRSSPVSPKIGKKGRKGWIAS